MRTWLLVICVAMSGCIRLLTTKGSGFTRDQSTSSERQALRDSRLEGGPTGDQPLRPDARSSERTLAKDAPSDLVLAPDRVASISPCQRGWSHGWVLQGQAGVNCYGSCSDTTGFFTIDCNWAGECVCSGPGINKKCPTASCEDLVDSGCCLP
jgi:hypothetical protein